MANEAVPIKLSPTLAGVRRTCSDSTGIPKYTLLALTDANTVAASAAAEAFGGVAIMEKVANDGSTSITADMSGVYDLTAAGAITVGDSVSLSGANLIKEATEAEIQAGRTVGWAEETATPNEVIRVRLIGGNL